MDCLFNKRVINFTKKKDPDITQTILPNYLFNKNVKKMKKIQEPYIIKIIHPNYLFMENNVKKNENLSLTNGYHELSVDKYIILNAKKTHNYNSTIQKNILGKIVEMYSGTPTIVELNDSYLINIRWINYSYNDDGSRKINPPRWISLNSRFTVDLNFNKISNETFLEDEFQKEKDYPAIGLEDIRIFKFNEKYYYISTHHDNNRHVTSVSSDIYNMSEPYKLNRNIILPTMYDLRIKRPEKNWSFVNYKNDLCIIYLWYPLKIGKIDYTTNLLTIIEEKNVPEYFKQARGSTCGYTKNNEIWFVVHKTQCTNTTHYNYQHFFAVFDLDMNLLRYSELFKFGDCKVEFCTGLIIKDDSIILSYSLMDTQSFISEYALDDINNIEWYKIESK